ncbi:MAG: DUF6340 family protein [Flavobacteriia bacterium]|jgi:hypothetical protein
MMTSHFVNYIGQIFRRSSLLVILAIILFLASCAGTRDMKVSVLRPAEITIPTSIREIAMLNRSIPTSTTGFEASLSGETPVRDKELSEDCMRGLTETLNQSVGGDRRFDAARCGQTMNAADGKSLGFGAPLDWKIIDSICTAQHVQALLVLEYFDTDYSIFNPGATAQAAVGAVLNGTPTAVEVKGTATAEAGFRVYDPSQQKILYEDRFQFKQYWTQRSVNPVEALAKLIKRNDALLNVSYNTGVEFAYNIVPLYFWEDRLMYKGKKGKMERGERQALAKDWDAALKTWSEVFETTFKSKIRAKAAFNAALACEVLGDLEGAQKWIQQAYVEGGKKQALWYSDIIDARIREQSKLDEQLEQ